MTGRNGQFNPGDRTSGRSAFFQNGRLVKVRGLGFLVALLFMVLPVFLDGANTGGELSFCLDRSFTAEGSEFFGPYQEVVVGPGGRIYVACNREHSILIFGENGRKLGAFGQKGRGPGDLFYPHRLSVLDGKYLVVGEYATNRRVSLFDLIGNFVSSSGLTERHSPLLHCGGTKSPTWPGKTLRGAKNQSMCGWLLSKT